MDYPSSFPSSVEHIHQTDSHSHQTPSKWYGIFYILLFISLLITLLSISGIIHSGIDKLFFDTPKNSLTSSVLLYSGNYILNLSIACLAITFPISLVLMIWLRFKTHKNPTIRQSIIRTILLYLGLVLAFLFVIFSLITLILGFLNGIIDTRAIVHPLATIVIASIVFVYMVLDLHGVAKNG